MRPIEVVKLLCPNAKSFYLAAIENGDQLFLDHGIGTPLRLAHLFAQCFEETGGLRIDWESGSYSADRIVQVFGPGRSSAAIGPDEAQRLAHNGPALFERTYGLGNPKLAKELGNTQPGDGWRYRGGGMLQTTGRGNYRRMGQKCGVDFEARPDLIISPEHALKPALIEWTEGNCNADADRDQIRIITKKINGGYNGLDERERWLDSLKRVINSVELRPAAVQAPKPQPTPIPPPAPKPAPQPTRGPLIAALVLLAAALAWTWAAVEAHPYLTATVVLALVGAAIGIVINHKRKQGA